MAIRKVTPTELKLYIQEDEQFCSKYFVPCVKELAKLKTANQLTDKKALLSFRKLAVRGSRELAKELGARIFLNWEVEECARLLSLDFESTYRITGYKSLLD
jgi:hypothetical protein